ncbi:MAG TPA: trypsin-like peptidase domain-containing protein [Marmoricola sp.]|nr:trypsin-like peptidase domain-containing protein [Marmoricola sp.]
MQPIPAADPPTEETREIPLLSQPAIQEQRPSIPLHPGRGFAAVVLTGALFLGGAAGIGGAAAYDTLRNQAGSSSTSSTLADDGVQTETDSTPINGGVEAVANKVLPSVVRVNVTGQSESGSGSGVILDKSGNILTNNHVVQSATQNGSISVSFNDGSTAPASVVGTDPLTDMAVIKVADTTGLTPATIGTSGKLRVGQQVVAIGSPFGLNATVTTGIVSALNRPVSVATTPEQPSPQSELPFGFGTPQQEQQQSLSTTYPAIQTDAAINPGNSGGPLVNMAGQVVGINSSIRTASDTSTSGGSIGLGFAIPMDEVMPVVQQILNNEKPTHARLGVSVGSSNDVLSPGAIVRSVEDNGAADRAGIKPGDVITRVGEHQITDAESLVATVRGMRPDQKVSVTVLRNGKSVTVQTTLGSDANTQTS